MKFSPPIKGQCSSFIFGDETPPLTTDYINNVLPIDTLEKKVRLGKRPPLDKVFNWQIGGTAAPIVWIGSITIVD